LSIQPFVGDDDTVPLGGQSRINQLEVIAGTNTAYPLAKAYKLKTAFGSDMLFSPEKATRQGIMLTHLKRWYENADILKMATGTNGELLALSGPRNPYPGKLGILEEGALADLIVVDGDPTADIALIENPEKNFLIIMKDGKIYKDTLHS
jgi:imidazolonepropionase-like amidohydrolase